MIPFYQSSKEGFIVRLYTGQISGASYERNADALDETISVKATTVAGNVQTGQVMSSPGILSMPVKGSKGLFVDHAGGMLCIAASAEGWKK